MSEDPKSAFERIFGRVSRAGESSKAGGTSMHNALVDALKKQKAVVQAEDAVEDSQPGPSEVAESKERVSAFGRVFGRARHAPLDPTASGRSTSNPFARPQRNQSPKGTATGTPTVVEEAFQRGPSIPSPRTFGSRRSVSKDSQASGPGASNQFARPQRNQSPSGTAARAVAAAPTPNAAHISLCLFDLDDTLIRTEDLDSFRGQANAGNKSPGYTRRLMDSYMSRDSGRFLYTPEQLAELRRMFPAMKWGVFTRSPRHYAETLLDAAYPGVPWDVVIGYEDVRKTKPNGEGIWAAMRQCGIQSTQQVALIGDNKVDVQAAYQGGCWSILDQSSWGKPWASERYWAVERLPDAIIDDPSMLGSVLEHPSLHWPEMEHQSDSCAVGKVRCNRLDTINHFYPEGGWVPITVMGRLFGEYEALKPRRSWHALTDQILAHKDAAQFPEGWVTAIRSYLGRAVAGTDSLITVIPFKPGRHPRLEALLGQVRASDHALPIRQGVPIEFDPAVLAFKTGAVSSHGRHLSKDERFANVGQNLFVQNTEAIRGKNVVVIDDVVTTGATLLWAHRYLLQAGARSVKCMALTKAVSDK